MLSIGDKAPEFLLPATIEGSVSLKKFKGKKVVLYFYPKDDTPGCTVEAKDFRDNIEAFKEAGVVVIGVSKDNLKCHTAFSEKYDLPFILASDEEGKAVEAYGVWVEKSMYGKKYMGIERSTYLINTQGEIQYIWSKIKVPGHVQEVLAQARR